MSQPEFTPIADAFRLADEAAKTGAPVDPFPAPPRGAPESPEDERKKNIAYLRSTMKRKGEAVAYAVGRAMKFSDAEIHSALYPPKPKKPPQPATKDADTGSSKDGGGAEKEAGSGGGSGGDGGSGGGWTLAAEPVKPLGDDCPVRPLGRMGDICYYLDPLNQLIAKKSHKPDDIRLLFANREGFAWLWARFPKFNAAGNQNGVTYDRINDSLVMACSERGVFDATRRVRGVGAWRCDDGSLLFHAGDAVYCNGEWRAPGEHDGFIYPASNPRPRPADTPDGARDVVHWLLERLGSWNWRDNEDPNTRERVVLGQYKLQGWLLVGFLMSAIVGGALDWRSLLWITGDAGSGKSTLLDLLRQILGDIVKAADATEAGVRAVLGQSSVPVLLDEVENDPMSPKNTRLVKLARVAASGDEALRGSSDHIGTTFMVRSSFLFSSIIIPPMQGQDVSRFAVLDLAPVGGGKSITLDPVRNAAVGRILRRLALDAWTKWPETLEAWRGVLAEQGHNARGCDQYGTLFAWAELAYFAQDGMDHDTRREIGQLVSRASMDQTAYNPGNAEAMLNHITTVPLDVFRGGTRVSIGSLVAGGAGLEELASGSPDSYKEALKAHGVFVEGFQSGARVTLPNQNEGLRRLFEGTQWRSDPGASGGWAQAMRRLADVRPENSRKLGGRGWSVPVRVFLMRDEEEGPSNGEGDEDGEAARF